MKTLFCGDPHATPDSIEEMWELTKLIARTAEEHQVDTICFLGDQYHTHSVIHLSVMAFWHQAFSYLRAKGFRIIALVGNHDKGGVAGVDDNALMLHAGITVVSSPQVIDSLLYVPYIHDPAQFVGICNAEPFRAIPTVVCHQTFIGSVFENGFPTADGVDLNLIPQNQVISGHIHTPQLVGKVWYPGAPRWRSVSDANIDRAIWVVEHDTQGLLQGRHAVSTATACIPMYCLDDLPEKPAELPTGRCKVVVDVYGPEAHVQRRKRELEELPGVRVRTFPDAEKSVTVRESDGLPVAMQKFLQEHKPKHETPPEVLWKLAQERISWLRAN